MRALLVLLAALLPSIASAQVAEICGNATDDNANGLTDEGCFSPSDVCESPLSCSDTGMVSPKKGALRYQLPPDVAPKVPYGPGIGFRRFYTSMYAPTTGAPVWHKPMGERWQHTYMTWLAKTGTWPNGVIVLHTNRGQDVRATQVAEVLTGWDEYKLQAGVHVHYLRQRQAAPNEFHLRMLSGETLVYNSSGKLTEIWDTLATPNKVLVSYDGAGQVSTVTDASGKRRLLFGYTSGALTSLQFQILIASVWTTQHTTSYAYTSGAMTSVTIGGQLAQTNVYTSGYLTRIQDGSAKTIADITYTTATPGKVARIDTPRGMIGFEWASTRSTCSGQTVLHFNRGTTGTCNVDGDCGSGYLCGGKTSTGSTGTCFRAARCLTVSSPSEDVVTTVAPIGPPSESCTGACTEVAQYVWNTGTGILNVAATQDPAGFFSSRALNTYGLPTTVSYGDSDSNASSGTQHRTEWRFYGNASFPGKVTEVRRKSDLNGSAASCSASNTTGCARTQYGYTADGKLQTITESGTMWWITNDPTAYTYVTTFSYDTKGRLTQIDGPLTGTDDVTQLTYHSPTGALKDDFVHEYKRKKDATAFVTQSAVDYDFWGNPTALVDADTTRTCLAFSAARGHLVSHTEKMTAHSDCSAHASNLVTMWARDSALRLTQVTRPDGSCIFYEYDAKARLQKIKRRDDCVAGNAGDTVELVYDTEGLVTETQTKNAAGTLTAKQPFTYHDSRRLDRIVNPVDTSKWTGLTYDSRGLLQQVDGPASLGKTVFNRSSTAGSPGAEGRVTSVDKYKTSSAFDSWNLLYDWLGNQAQVTDGDSFATVTKRDDLGRTFRFNSPDLTHPREHFFDAASRLIFVNEAVGGGTAARSHAFAFDHLGRPIIDEYAGACTGTSPPYEINRVYDAPPVTCPISGGCNRTQGRLAYVKTTLFCDTSLTDGSLDQETFYSYDDAGRMITEYIRDDGGRIAIQHFGWTANGDLKQVTTPSGAVIGSTYGSAGNNSDTDRITAVWRTSTSTLVVDQVQWEPFGPLREYNQQSTVAGVATRTRITRNLAYRVAKLDVATQTGSATLHTVEITEDAKGRVTARDYTPNITGVEDSYFRYDDQDRVLCETTTSVATCPTSGTNIKNSHTASPPFRNAGEWKELKRPIPGSTGLTHVFNSGITPTNHQIKNVTQTDGSPTYGATSMQYDAYGNRTYEGGRGLTARTLTYDKRHNLVGVQARPGSDTLVTTSAFDAQTRRVYKQVRNLTTSSTDKYWFYYDPLGRLIEMSYTIGTDPTVYVIQFFWLGDRLTAMWETWSGWATGTSKRYVHTDETSRPVELWTWPATGDTTRLWAINPSAWGFDTNVVGPNVLQPFLFAGQFQDRETMSSVGGTIAHRPGLALHDDRTYDPFSGVYVQATRMPDQTTPPYIFAASNPVKQRNRPSTALTSPLAAMRDQAKGLAFPDLDVDHYEVYWMQFYIPGRNQCDRIYNPTPGPMSSMTGSTSSLYISNSPNVASAFSEASAIGRESFCSPTTHLGWVHVQCVTLCGQNREQRICEVVSPGYWNGFVLRGSELGVERPGVHNDVAEFDFDFSCACGLPSGVCNPKGDGKTVGENGGAIQ